MIRITGCAKYVCVHVFSGNKMTNWFTDLPVMPQYPSAHSLNTQYTFECRSNHPIAFCMQRNILKWKTFVYLSLCVDQTLNLQGEKEENIITVVFRAGLSRSYSVLQHWLNHLKKNKQQYLLSVGRQNPHHDLFPSAAFLNTPLSLPIEPCHSRRLPCCS